MNDSTWEYDFNLMLEAYGLTMADVQEALPRAVPSLSPDEVATLHGADFDHPELMNEDQAGIFCVLLVRAVGLLSADWAERERLQRSSHN